MLQSLEVDIYPLCDPRAADLIDGALGDGSQFHVAFGCYAHGVGPETSRGSGRVARATREARRALSTGFGGDGRCSHKIDGTGLTSGDATSASPSRIPQDRCRPAGELETFGGQEQPAATSGQSS
jgi:hypothetical protein